jgi:hypothetical protein
VTRTMSGYLPSVVAVVLTVLLGGLFSLVPEDGQSLNVAVLGVFGLLSLLVPFVVPLVWTWALLMGRPHRLVLFGSGLWLVTGLMMPGAVMWSFTTHVVSGLMIGLGLMSRWKPGLILILLAMVSTPFAVWNLNQEPMDEWFEILKEQNLETRRELLMEGTKAGEDPPALVMEEQIIDDLFNTMRQLTPGILALGNLFQATLTFGFIWFVLRLQGLTAGMHGFSTFGRWRFPFAVIWALALAVGLLIVPLPWWPYAGANLAMVVVGLLAIQGAAVQWRMSAVGIPVLLRLFFLFIAGMLFLPLVILGIADQWLDIRKLDAEESNDSDNTGGKSVDPATDADDASPK